MLLTEIKNDLISIPLHELPSSNLMYSLMSMNSIIRLLNENVEKALSGYRKMDESSFVNFFSMLDNAHMQMCLHLIDMEYIARVIQKDCEI